MPQEYFIPRDVVGRVVMECLGGPGSQRASIQGRNEEEEAASADSSSPEFAVKGWRDSGWLLEGEWG